MTTQTITLADSAMESRPVRKEPSKLAGLALASWFNFKAMVTQPMNLVFSIGLPMFMYYMFGTGHDYVHHSVGNGNVSAQIMVSMTTYGVLISLSSLGANSALERSNGWVRQIALTPLRISGWVVSKMIAALAVGWIIIVACYSFGYFMDAQMTTQAWVETAIMAWICAAMAAPFGLTLAFVLKSEVAFSVLGALSSIFAFASGMFIPLDQMGKGMQTLAQFMPYYGVNRVPLGFLFGADQLTWKDWASVIAWFVIFVVVAVSAARRRSER